ncbi:hypothetical protein DXU04_25255 [Bradyrhizobium diazoefficiens]
MGPGLRQRPSDAPVPVSLITGSRDCANARLLRCALPARVASRADGQYRTHCQKKSPRRTPRLALLAALPMVPHERIDDSQCCRRDATEKVIDASDAIPRGDANAKLFRRYSQSNRALCRVRRQVWSGPLLLLAKAPLLEKVPRTFHGAPAG